MKVLLVTQEYPPRVLGGVGYHVYHLANALTERGHTVHVLTGASDRHARDDSLPPNPDVSVSTVRYRRPFAPRLWFARRARRWLQSWDRLASFDVVHAHEYLDFDRIDFDGTAIQKVHFNLTEKPNYLSLDALPGALEPAAFALAQATVWRAERRLERRAVETADVAIANSRLTRTLLRERHSLAGSHLEVVYNGVDVDRFRPGSGSAGGGFLLYVGGDSARKGYHGLLDALGRLDAGVQPTVKIVGGAESVDRASLEAALPVQFLGRVSQARLEALYRDADALVHPALYEPFGNVVLEALACGTPVVVADADHCGAAELVDGATGIVVDPTAVASLAEAMRSVDAAPDRFSSTDCRSLATGHTWDDVAERTIEIARDTR